MSKMCAVKSGSYVQIECDMTSSSANVTILDKDQETILSTVFVDNLHPTVTIAVCFSGETPSKVTLTGSSCEKKDTSSAAGETPALSKEAETAKSDPVAAAAQSVAT